MRIWEEYIKAVETGQRNAGRLEHLAVKHVKKLATQYDFDTEEADRVLSIVSYMKYPTGKWKGHRFDLMPHQAFFIAYLFGLMNKDGNRLIREAMLNMAKKGGKSALDAVIGVLFTFFDGEQTAEGYVVANKTDQTLFCWKAAKNICLQLKDDFPEEFGIDFKYYDNRQDHTLIQPSSENFFKTLPYESNTLDGVNPHIAIVDEFHEYPDTSVPDNLQSGMVLRDQPLLLYSTTRGFHPYGPLAEKEEYYENVLTGLVEDSRVFPLIFSLDDDNNWKNKNYWIQFAPGIEYNLPPPENLEREMRIAIEEGGEKLVSCKTKNFNIWQRAKSSFANKSGWDAGAKPFEESQLHGRKALAAFDIGGRYHIFSGEGLIPSDGMQLRFRLPVLSADYEIDNVAPRFTIATSQQLSETFALFTNWGGSWNGVNSIGTGFYSINLAFPIAGKLGGFVESYGSLTDGDFDSRFDYLEDEDPVTWSTSVVAQLADLQARVEVSNQLTIGLKQTF